ncbi:MAG: BamA/TamA family outer membrane protein [Candidatus Latescibacteria bacterium]|nr:BamA/TamA family outer membrane protein [Candidatus Latescibacterota bacterium]
MTKYSPLGHATLSAEFAGGRLNGDVKYTRSLLNTDFRIPSGRDAAFGLKLFAGFSNQRLPLHKRFEFGGIGMLPGYRYKEFGGDRAFLIHGEYLFGSERFRLVPFVGAGAAWSHDQRFDADLVKYNAGIGVEVGEGRDRVRIDFARPVGEGERTTWEKHLLFLRSR